MDESAGKATFRPSSDVSWRDVQGELVVLNLKTGDYHVFNEVGRKVWLEIVEGHCIEETVATLIGEYEAERAAVDSDVAGLVEALVEKGLLERVGVEEAPG